MLPVSVKFITALHIVQHRTLSTPFFLKQIKYKLYSHTEGKRKRQRKTREKEGVGKADFSLPSMTPVFLHLYIRTQWEDRQVYFSRPTHTHAYMSTQTHTHTQTR